MSLDGSPVYGTIGASGSLFRWTEHRYNGYRSNGLSSDRAPGFPRQPISASRRQPRVEPSRDLTKGAQVHKVSVPSELPVATVCPSGEKASA